MIRQVLAVPNILRRQGSSIPVILLESVDNWGAAGDVISVKRGFARNFLIPRAKAAYATPENKTRFAALKSTTKAPNRADATDALRILTAGRHLEIRKEANDKGTLFAAVTTGEVLAALKVLGAPSVPSMIDDKSFPIMKEIGEYTVTAGDVEIKVVVTR